MVVECNCVKRLILSDARQNKSKCKYANKNVLMFCKNKFYFLHQIARD